MPRPRGRREKHRQIAREIADDRHSLPGEGSEDQFASLAVGENGAGYGIDDFRVEMVFPDCRAVFGFDTFLSDARPHDFRKAVDVNGIEIPAGFDFLPHGFCPGFGATDRDFQ